MLTTPWFPRRVLVSHTLHEGLADHLHSRRPDIEFRARGWDEITPEDVAWSEVFVGFRSPGVPGWERHYRWIHCIGAGVDAFAFRTGLASTTLLTRTSEDFGPQIGEYCLSRTLAVTQRLRRLEADQRLHRWRPKHPSRLRGTRALVVGTGSVGRGIAQALERAGVTVDGLSLSGRAREGFVRALPVTAFAAAVTGAQWLILACPLTEASFHLLGRDRLAVAAGSYLINVGRGRLVDETVLPEALDAGWISGAALDVFETEPLPADSPLWDRDDVTISPHISGLTTVVGAAAGFLQCLAEVEAGVRPALTVDPVRGY